MCTRQHAAAHMTNQPLWFEQVQLGNRGESTTVQYNDLSQSLGLQRCLEDHTLRGHIDLINDDARRDPYSRSRTPSGNELFHERIVQPSTSIRQNKQELCSRKQHAIISRSVVFDGFQKHSCSKSRPLPRAFGQPAYLTESAGVPFKHLQDCP